MPLLVAGLGEGGMIAFYAGALDTRISSVYVWGYFAAREALWSEPIYRNLFGLLNEFGDAEIASLIAPRHLVVQHLGYPNVQGPPAATQGQRSIAAPGKIMKPSLDDMKAEVARAQQIVPGDWIKLYGEDGGLKEVVGHLLPEVATPIVKSIEPIMPQKNEQRAAVDATRQERQVRELETFTQRLLVDTEAERNATFWKPLPLSSIADFEKRTATERERFWNDTIGRLPDPNVPMNAKSRLVKETDKVTIYEVTLDVWQGRVRVGLARIAEGSQTR